MITEKQCIRCKTIKPISEFTVAKNRKDGYYCFCKECSRNQNNSINAKNVQANTDERLAEFAKNNPFRLCNKCKQLKPITEFIICRQRKDGYETCCKDCQHEKYHTFVEGMTDERLAQIAIEKPLKTCTDCGEEKSIKDFPICRENPDGRHYYCNSCAIERMRKYYWGTVERRIGYRNSHKGETSVRYRKSNETLKIEVLTHYGKGKCACVVCGENRLACLSIDHINGGGSKHRKSISPNGCSGVRFYKWLKDHNLPDGFQTLCMNDQFIKAYERGIDKH